MTKDSRMVMGLVFLLGLILFAGGCNGASKETVVSKEAPAQLSDQEILNLLGKAEQIPYDIEAKRVNTIIKDENDNYYLQLPASLDSPEKIHKLYAPYWTEEAIKKFMQPYKSIDGNYCISMGDWGDMGAHIDRVTIVNKEKNGDGLIKISVSVEEPDGTSTKEMYEIQYVEDKWLVNLSPMMSAL